MATPLGPLHPLHRSAGPPLSAPPASSLGLSPTVDRTAPRAGASSLLGLQWGSPWVSPVWLEFMGRLMAERDLQSLRSVSAPSSLTSVVQPFSSRLKAEASLVWGQQAEGWAWVMFGRTWLLHGPLQGPARGASVRKILQSCSPRGLGPSTRSEHHPPAAKWRPRR